jgi:hypothetical protein
MHGATHRLPKGRLSELIGRIAATGEQLGLAWTCEQDMRSWLEPSAPKEERFAVSSRALAEITGYYAISAGHGIANVTLRTLLVHSGAAAIINQDKDLKRAKGFAPFSTIPAAWVPLNEKLATLLQTAAATAGQPTVDSMADRVVAWPKTHAGSHSPTGATSTSTVGGPRASPAALQPLIHGRDFPTGVAG